ncbi:hypothetical protein FE810_04715 [Thalassotalea litorea]|uniref:Uncharacterized protein n=1 Tax=Thalassotalea litorea TaxID=2020715 RepID=A0A5R9IQQ8_9GAMM|nr:hypothetical protein [Thalassotalea litorea]TLU66813.1 hypothetical protein FE810_04715 [Thalassotalea litorea]
MSNVIQLLERLGEEANLSEHTLENLQKQMANLELSELTQEAILQGDPQALESLLGLSPNLCNIVHQDDDEESDDNEEDTSDNNEQASSQQAIAM